jgi:hypothetical protein
MVCISNMLQTAENTKHNTDDKHCFTSDKTVLCITLASINHRKIPFQWAGGTQRKATLHQLNLSYFMHHPALPLHHWNRRILDYMFRAKMCFTENKIQDRQNKYSKNCRLMNTPSYLNPTCAFASPISPKLRYSATKCVHNKTHLKWW